MLARGLQNNYGTLGSRDAMRRYRQLRRDIGLRQRRLDTASYGFLVSSQYFGAVKFVVGALAPFLTR
jgi:hypothetical protein